MHRRRPSGAVTFPARLESANVAAMLLERALQSPLLRSTAQSIFARNQSRAKVVLDPLYTLAARALLRGDIPLSKEVASRRYPDNLFPAYRQRSRKMQYFIEDWDFSEARPELLTETQRRLVHTTTLGETSGMAVSDGFLRAFRTSPELGPFFGTWFVEELNHYEGLHRYAARMGEAWAPRDIERVAEVEFLPYSDDIHEIATCNMFQELVAYLVYRSFASQVGDPFLARMLKQISKDELRHFRFYQDVVARQIQRDPSFRVTVLKVFLKATTPYNQVSGGPQRAVEHVLNGFFYFRKKELDYFLDQVELLLGTRLEPAFDAYFGLFTPDCALCSVPLHRCECTVLEPATPARESDAAIEQSAAVR
jgi:hypothetical protein